MAEILPDSVNIGPTQAEKNQKAWFFGCAGCGLLMVAGILAFVFALFLFITGIIKSTDAYKGALQAAQNSAEVKEALGEPIKDGWLPMGSVKTTNDYGTASLRITVYGPKGEGTLDVNASKQPGQPWRYAVLECAVEETGRIINLKNQAVTSP